MVRSRPDLGFGISSVLASWAATALHPYPNRWVSKVNRASYGKKWEEKEPRVVWRGGTTGIRPFNDLDYIPPLDRLEAGACYFCLVPLFSFLSLCLLFVSLSVSLSLSLSSSRSLSLSPSPPPPPLSQLVHVGSPRKLNALSHTHTHTNTHTHTLSLSPATHNMSSL